MDRNKRIISAAIVFAVAVAIVAVYAYYSYAVVHQDMRASGAGSLNEYFNTSAIRIVYGENTLQGNAYIAASPQQQYQGYMNSTSIGNCSGKGNCIGMLFVFQNQSEECFWMKNTIIPLRQLWIDQNGIVEYAYNASPYSTKTVCAQGEYVLETQLDIPIGAYVFLQANGTK